MTRRKNITMLEQRLEKIRLMTMKRVTASDMLSKREFKEIFMEIDKNNPVRMAKTPAWYENAIRRLLFTVVLLQKDLGYMRRKHGYSGLELDYSELQRELEGGKIPSSFRHVAEHHRESVVRRNVVKKGGSGNKRSALKRGAKTSLTAPDTKGH